MARTWLSPSEELSDKQYLAIELLFYRCGRRERCWEGLWPLKPLQESGPSAKLRRGGGGGGEGGGGHPGSLTPPGGSPTNSCYVFVPPRCSPGGFRPRGPPPPRSPSGIRAGSGRPRRGAAPRPLAPWAAGSSPGCGRGGRSPPPPRPVTPKAIR